ncbi:S8 family serine peptidase [Microbispora sp. RL4-1S]|uniref:S8 family serine peptidase n=1 Tax=Microbispora oryzae TaxID=2806554 RepID=A0A941AHC6_9ACTN|nr:S8 family serine peptidase [Microbispora oryzae]MBP2703945.1 S8 family serine peptidase [Microbispora oryzae]
MVLIGTAALAMLLPQTAAIAAPATPDPTKIDKALQQDLSAHGKTTFWVRLKDHADLGAARVARSKSDKGRQVYRLKTETAASSQAGLRKLLTSAHADFTPFWIVNAVKVTGDAKLAADIAKLPEVASIEPSVTVPLPDPQPAKAAKAATTSAATVEWNVDRINAPKVWNELGDHGEGIVIASIDTGVQWDHPALVSHYRGTKADGTVDHNYNWYDPAGACPDHTPCDDRGHGTHTVGTMVGGDGGANNIGVAPGAKWIAAKGCLIDGCPDYALLAAGQWILAPTDLNGQNPRPDLAPDIVNNSWGGTGIDLWYKDMVEAWVAAGIFPAFSNGNAGQACDTTGTPGGYAASYSAGAFDSSGQIAYFSSRGPGENGEIKPNISAPGVDIRSALPGNGYGLKSGTSMASPHVAATVALMWSASPYLRNDIEGTRALLDRTAADVDDESCGGTAADNFVWGEGMLDAYAAVKSTPAGELGTMTGTVTSGGAPVAGATVGISGPLNRTVSTGPDGTYTLPRLLSGDYQFTVRKFAYDDVTRTVTVAVDQTVTADATLTAQAMSTVSGTVTSVGEPESGATVTAAGTPATTVTDARGHYELLLPHTTYDLKVTADSLCAEDATVSVTVGGDTTKDIELSSHIDAFGYTCRSGKEAYVEATTPQPLTDDDDTQVIDLPFAFPFYGKTYTRGRISTNGYLTFGMANGYSFPSNTTLPRQDEINAGVYPYWDDLALYGPEALYTAVLGTAPNRTFVVEWRNVKFYNADEFFSFEALLGEDGSVEFRYRGLDTVRKAGESATVGIENEDGTDAFQYSFESPVLRDGQSLTIAARGRGLLTGVVTDANDGGPLAGATVRVDDAAAFTTGPDGAFLGQVPAGDHRVEISADNYGTLTKEVTVAAGGRNRMDAALATGRVTASTDRVTLVMPASATRKSTFQLANPGADATYTVENDPAQTWLSVTPASGRLAAGATATIQVAASSAGVEPGTVRTGTLLVRSSSGRAPVVPVTVLVVVPKVQVAVEAGGGKAVTDAGGDTWAADRKFTTGGYGYVGDDTKASTSATDVKGTTEQGLFRSAREGMRAYRFDRLPDGVYTVELGFAETRHKKPGKRVFDVSVAGRRVIEGLDLAREAGENTAVTRQYTVKVAGGRLDVAFRARVGDPIVNFVRVTERPDRTAS